MQNNFPFTQQDDFALRMIYEIRLLSISNRIEVIRRCSGAREDGGFGRIPPMPFYSDVKRRYSSFAKASASFLVRPPTRW